MQTPPQFPLRPRQPHAPLQQRQQQLRGGGGYDLQPQQLVFLGMGARDVGPGFGQAIGPGFGQAMGPDDQQAIGPGFGQAMGPDEQQAVNPGDQQAVNPGDQQAVNPDDHLPHPNQLPFNMSTPNKPQGKNRVCKNLQIQKRLGF